MESIIGAAPCHVLVNWKADRNASRYDVVCWTVDEYGTPVPWIVIDGKIWSLEALGSTEWKITAATLCNGTAASMVTNWGRL